MKDFQEIVKRAREKGLFRVCVAAAEDQELLSAVKMACDMGFVKPVLTGSREKIDSCAKGCGLTGYEVIECGNPQSAAEAAVLTVKEGRADILMKGLVNTSVYMRAILNRDKGLRTGNLISLLAVYQLPGYHKLIFGTDSGINIAPDLDQKKAILKNALEAMAEIGVECPKVAALTANEVVDPKISSTVDAAELAKLTGSCEFPSCVVEGPIAFDVAFDPHAAAHKGIDSKITGDVDLLVFPNIEAGNVLGKSWLHFGKAKWAGIVLGAAKPVILGSRSDTAEIKINSIALGCLASGAK